MKIEIKRSYNTIHEKLFYWTAPNGYTISIVKGQGSLFTDEELQDILRDKINKYVKGLSARKI